MNTNLGLLIKRLAILAAPFLTLLASYVVLDPFHVIRRDPEAWVFHGVFPNREVISTEFLLRRADRAFDAFVFGNSRSQAFQCRDWASWIGPARPFHYDALRDTLFGVRGKVRLLERQGYPLRHALVVVDPEFLRQTTDSADIVSVKHPAVSENALHFHSVFLKAFFSDLFVVKYLDYRLFGTLRPYMAGAITDNQLAVSFDRETFDVFLTNAEQEIAARPDRYYAARGMNVDRTPRDAMPAIQAPQLAMLEEVRASFARQGTDYQFVVSPDFARIRIHSADLTVLSGIFGADRVHDFSRDPGLGLDLHDWYDKAHYRPSLAREMLARIYGDGSLHPARLR